MFHLLEINLFLLVFFMSLFNWAMTFFGAALVYFVKKESQKLLSVALGLSAGIMIAASFWSLLNPAIDKATSLGMNAWLVAFLGFISGGILIFLSDIIFERLLKKRNIKNNEGIKRNILLIFSITLHNIPEGLAIGVAFGGIASGTNTLLSALMLAIGIGIQNFPEGCAVSLPLRREGLSRTKSFIYGMMSGIVEPISGILGAILVIYVTNTLPFFLSFAAGAMIYVAVSELIPESQKNTRKNLMTLFTLLGFSIMMILDVALG